MALEQKPKRRRRRSGGKVEGGDVRPRLDRRARGGGKLSAAERRALPDGSFALPGERYPINDESHARNALARVSGNGTPEEKTKVRAAVKRKYPGIGQSK